MENYTITADGAIVLLGDRKPAKGEEVFSDSKTLGLAIATFCPDKQGDANRLLLSAYNRLRGAKKVKRFETYEIGLARTIKTLGGKASAQAARASSTAPAKAKASAKGRRAGAQAAPKASKNTTPAEGRPDSKKATVLEMLRSGCTREAIAKVTGWQAHTIRGFLATAGKAHNIQSTGKNAAGERTYKIAE